MVVTSIIMFYQFISSIQFYFSIHFLTNSDISIKVNLEWLNCFLIVSDSLIISYNSFLSLLSIFISDLPTISVFDSILISIVLNIY